MATCELLEPYLTESDLAKALDKSVRTLQRWERLRIGPTRTLIGNSPYYHRDDIAAWLKSCREERTRR